jgi:hypothetical protein
MRFISLERDTGKCIRLPDTRRDDCAPLDAAPRTPYAHSRGTAGITHAMVSFRCLYAGTHGGSLLLEFHTLELVSQALHRRDIDRLIRLLFHELARMANIGLERSDLIISFAIAPDRLSESGRHLDIPL